METKARIIAFYLPQYHPTPENNEWWGQGFTEWTNVGKAKPLFKGHYQPRVPADLGYYDLRLAETREQQAELAREAGVEGFCYWHYWFGNGKRLLETPFSEVLSSGKPDFPFCLGWANESWQAKIWGTDGKNNKMLVEQTYPGEKDIDAHFYSCLSAFQDRRYIRVEGKPFFLIYRPLAYENMPEFIIRWNVLARQNGISGFHFVAQAASIKEYDKLINMGFSAITISPTTRINYTYTRRSKIVRGVLKKMRSIRGIPLIIDYNRAYPFFINKDEDSIENVIPSIIPNWDHSPRSGLMASLLHNVTPSLFRKHVKAALQIVSNKPKDKQLLLLKSWNEWGEGNYVEPDLKFGKAFIQVLGEENKL